jgi:hypothetical protein
MARHPSPHPATPATRAARLLSALARPPSFASAWRLPCPSLATCGAFLLALWPLVRLTRALAESDAPASLPAVGVVTRAVAAWWIGMAAMLALEAVCGRYGCVRLLRSRGKAGGGADAGDGDMGGVAVDRRVYAAVEGDWHPWQRGRSHFHRDGDVAGAPDRMRLL